ncbi:MAG TPA: hypothetical protein VKY19_12765 [Ktedonosporobacter sp.]|jgi:hypothetical protein|nr:hypothetical protein [Ktedonosporobacter sp.]
MKFQVTYRLTHPEYLPTIAHAVISAHTHQQFDASLSRLADKWRDQGYAFHVLAIKKRGPPRQR